MTNIEEYLNKFNNLPEDFKAYFNSQSVFNSVENIEKEYGVDIKFLIILLAINEVAISDIPEYLMLKYNLSEEDSFDVKFLILKDIFGPLIKDRATLSEYDMGKLVSLDNIDSEKFINFFDNNIINILNDDGFKDKINEAIILIFSKKPEFRDELVKELYKNQEVLTHKPFIVGTENETATVANWLNDFIAKNGSDIFSNIVLAKYLTSSENAKILDPAERNSLKKLLKLYRNLVFFPDSMKDIPIDDWEIFPVNRDQVEKVFHPAKLSGPDVSTPVPTPVIDHAEATAAAKKILDDLESGKTKIMPKEESPEIKSLRAMAAQYSSGSLERRAIEAEIKKKIQ